VLKAKYREEQITLALKQAETSPVVPEVARKGGISVQAFYDRRKEYGGFDPPELQHLKQPEMIADRSLDNSCFRIYR
jgi:hypothetical protein